MLNQGPANFDANIDIGTTTLNVKCESEKIQKKKDYAQQNVTFADSGEDVH